MRDRFTRSWGQASVVVGGGVFVVALLVAWWLGFSSDDEFGPYSRAVHILAALVVSLAGFVVGGTMIVAGQLVSALLDQRALLAQIRDMLTEKTGAGENALGR